MSSRLGALALSIALLLPGLVLAGGTPKIRIEKLKYKKKQKIVLCLPERQVEGFDEMPFVLLVHGGAWYKGLGSLKVFRSHCEYLAGLGYAAATMDYRLAPLHKYPAQPNDVKEGIEWVRDHIHEYGTDEVPLDADKILLVGHSAGGHLSMLVGLMYPELPLVGIVSLAGPTDLTKKGSCIPCQYHRRSFLGTKSAAKASPINHVRADAPPIYLFHGDSDKVVNTNQSRMMAEALEEIGAVYKLEIIEGLGHYFPFKGEHDSEVVTAIMDFVLEGSGLAF
jgi:acetyl esterase/lipase